MFAAHGVLLPRLMSANAKTAYVSTSETTTSTSYTDLTTTTDSVTVTIGSSGSALVMVQSYLGNNASAVALRQTYVSYAVSGATTIAASDNYGLFNDNIYPRVGAAFLVTGITAGDNTFKMKYRVTANTTGTFANRRITVVPL